MAPQNTAKFYLKSWLQDKFNAVGRPPHITTQFFLSTEPLMPYYLRLYSCVENTRQPVNQNNVERNIIFTQSCIDLLSFISFWSLLVSIVSDQTYSKFLSHYAAACRFFLAPF